MKSKKVGNTTIKIYERVWGEYKGKKLPLFSVVYKLDGKRIWKNFRQEAEANRYATHVATMIEKGQVAALSLTNHDREDYLRALAVTQPLGISLYQAVEGYSQALKNKTLPAKKISEVVEELLKRKQSSGLSKAYIKALRSYLARFAAAFRTNIGNVTTAMIVHWLDSMKELRPKSRNNLRQAIANLFQFARSRGYLPKGLSTEADDVETVRDDGGEITFLKPVQLALLLEKANPIHQLYLALGAFTGIRSAELLRLEWDEINFRKGHIEVKARKAKTATRRLVPIQPNLMQWLSPYRGQSGKLFHGRRMVEAVTAFARAQGVEWTRNVLRHSYATYRLSALPDAARVALEMGTSPAKLFSNYRELDRENHAPDWFAMRRNNQPTFCRLS